MGCSTSSRDLQELIARAQHRAAWIAVVASMPISIYTLWCMPSPQLVGATSSECKSPWIVCLHILEGWRACCSLGAVMSRSALAGRWSLACNAALPVRDPDAEFGETSLRILWGLQERFTVQGLHTHNNRDALREFLGFLRWVGNCEVGSLVGYWPSGPCAIWQSPGN